MGFTRKSLPTAALKNRDINGKSISLIEVRKDLTFVYITPSAIPVTNDFLVLPCLRCTPLKPSGD